MWIQLLAPRMIETAGRPVRYMPGDWVDVGRQTAMLWVGEGTARLMQNASSVFPQSCGAVMRNGDMSNALESYRDFLTVRRMDKVDMPFERTLLWDCGQLKNFRTSLVPVGFNMLSTWQIAAPLWSYKELVEDIAADIGEDEITLSVIKDLRVPLYDTRVIFVSRCEATRQLFNLWRGEIEKGLDERLSFLRALYTVKPTMCALPVTWGNR